VNVSALMIKEAALLLGVRALANLAVDFLEAAR